MIDFVPELAMGGVIAILGYFLKVVHTDVRTNTKEIGENKGKIDQVERDVQHEKEMRNEQFTFIKETLQEVKDYIKKEKGDKNA